MEFRQGQWVVRPYREEDAAALLEALQNSYEHLRPWMPWARPDDTLEDRRDYCRRMARDFEAGTDYTMGLFEGETLLAATGFHLRVGAKELKNAEIGMWVRGDRAGGGVGTRLLSMLLEWGFSDDWGWERLVWKCDAANVGSARVAEKNGMRLEGRFLKDSLNVAGERSDTLQYALLRGEYRGPSAPPSGE
jgi:RimJ/RimL family protein N-acetyltransferase